MHLRAEIVKESLIKRFDRAKQDIELIWLDSTAKNLWILFHRKRDLQCLKWYDLEPLHLEKERGMHSSYLDIRSNIYEKYPEIKFLHVLFFISFVEGEINSLNIT